MSKTVKDNLRDYRYDRSESEKAMRKAAIEYKQHKKEKRVKNALRSNDAYILTWIDEFE
jgi:hypothetical protein